MAPTITKSNKNKQMQILSDKLCNGNILNALRDIASSTSGPSLHTMVSKEEEKSKLFPTIGEIAETSDSVKEPNSQDVEATDDTDRAVQEIESLCMHCGENVTGALP